MKLPKEIREGRSQEEYKKNQIFSHFKNEFKKLNKKYEPLYNVSFLKIGQKGKYSEFLRGKINGFNKLDEKHFIVMVKEYDYIELYINWERLGKLILNGKLVYDIEHHYNFFKNLYEQTAYHEYGHTYLVESCTTMFHPKEVIQLLKKYDIKGVSNIPEDKQEEFRNAMINSEQHKKNELLTNITFINIAEGILECHANYTVLTKLNPRVPKEFIELAKVDLVNGLHDINKYKNTYTKSYLYRRINDWSIKANDLFIYNKWNILEEYFIKYGLQDLSKFAYELNNRYLDIVKKYKDIDSMKEVILQLAEEMNEKDAYQIVKLNK